MPMLRPILALTAAAALLAACATPREACINRAQSQMRTLLSLADETRGNLSRGFAYETRQEVRTVRDTCTGVNEDGSTFAFSCEEVQTFNRRVPVAINLTAEEAKLASLEARIAEEQRSLQPRIDACIAANPE